MIGPYCNDSLILVEGTPGSWGAVTEKEKKFMGRIEFRSRMIRNLAGEQVMSLGKVLCPLKRTQVHHTDKIKYDGVEYSILLIDEVKAFSASHLKLEIQ